MRGGRRTMTSCLIVTTDSSMSTSSWVRDNTRDMYLYRKEIATTGVIQVAFFTCVSVIVSLFNLSLSHLPPPLFPQLPTVYLFSLLQSSSMDL